MLCRLLGDHKYPLKRHEHCAAIIHSLIVDYPYPYCRFSVPLLPMIRTLIAVIHTLAATTRAAHRSPQRSSGSRRSSGCTASTSPSTTRATRSTARQSPPFAPPRQPRAVAARRGVGSGAAAPQRCGAIGQSRRSDRFRCDWPPRAGRSSAAALRRPICGCMCVCECVRARVCVCMCVHIYVYIYVYTYYS